MNPALLVCLAAAAVVAVAAVLVVASLAGRRRLRAELAAARADVDALRDRVDGLGAPEPAERLPVPRPDFVITTLHDSRTSPADPGTGLSMPEPERTRLTAGEFASVAMGESLVRVLALGHGVRRALSAENRNRIRFEMRREVKRSRRQRRRDLKEAKRHLRADQRADPAEDAA